MQPSLRYSSGQEGIFVCVLSIVADDRKRKGVEPLRNPNSTVQCRRDSDSKISHRNDREVFSFPEFSITNLSLYILDLLLRNLVSSNISIKDHTCLGLPALKLVPNKESSTSENGLPISPLYKSSKITESKYVEMQNHVLPNLEQWFPNKILLSNPTKIESWHWKMLPL